LVFVLDVEELFLSGEVPDLDRLVEAGRCDARVGEPVQDADVFFVEDVVRELELGIG
jgi:hypothetical protein